MSIRTASTTSLSRRRKPTSYSGWVGKRPVPELSRSQGHLLNQNCVSISSFCVGNSTPMPTLSGHLVILVTIIARKLKVRTFAMIDSGSNSRAIMDSEFARKNQLPLSRLVVPRDLNVADGRPVRSGAITHQVRSSMRISRHSEKVSFLTTTLANYPVILGRPWLIAYNP